MTSEDKRLLKRIIFIAVVVLLFGVVFVSPCIHSQPQAPTTGQVHDCDADSCALPAGAAPAAPAAPVTKLIKEDNWQFTLPGDDWDRRDLPDDTIKVALLGHDDALLILFIKEEGSDSFQEYVMGSIRAFAEMEFQIDSIKQVVVNGNKFILVQVNKGDKVIWNWITFKDGIGYNLACGAAMTPDAGASLHEACVSISETLQIQ